MLWSSELGVRNKFYVIRDDIGKKKKGKKHG